MFFRRKDRVPEIEIEYNDTWKTETELTALSQKFISLLSSDKSCPIEELADIINELNQ